MQSDGNNKWQAKQRKQEYNAEDDWKPYTYTKIFFAKQALALICALLAKECKMQFFTLFAGKNRQNPQRQFSENRTP